MKREMAAIFTRTLKNIWFFYNKKIRFYQVENYLDIDVSRALPGNAIDILMKSCQALNSCKISYSLGWGTALGIHRGGQLIPHDNDLDFDVFDCTNYDLIITALGNIGIKLARKVSYNQAVQQLIFVDSDGIIVDFLFWKKKGKNYVNYSEPGYILKLSKRLISSGIQMGKYNNYDFPVLVVIEEYLETLYGSDWRIPKKSKGDWKDDCQVLYKKFDPFWFFYKKIAPFYLNLKKRLYPPPEIPKSFLELNKNFWAPIPKYEKYFLLDLTIHDHEYYNVHLITARALSEILVANPITLLPKRQSGEVSELVRSYGIKKIVYLEDYKISLFFAIGLFFQAIYLWLINRTKESWLAIKFKGITIGHYIYDEYIGYTRRGTLKVWDPRLVKITFKSLKYFYQYQQIFDEKKYELYFGIEQVYARSGMASAAAISKGVKMLLRKYGPNQVAYRSYISASDLDLFSTHPIIEDFRFQIKNNPEIALAWSEKYFNNLFSGEVDKYDWNAQNAYATAQPIKPDDYRNLFQGEYKYCVFIFSHVFIDAVHCYRQGLFPDYETWLRETLKIAAKRKDTLWIIKPHPSDNHYAAKCTSKDVYNDFKQYDNIRMFPDNTLLANLLNKIDAVLTFRGTAAGEYSCMGIPAITAGRSMFDEGEFCISPKNIAEYVQVLTHYEFKRLPDDIIRKARIYYYVYNISNRVDMPLLNDIMVSSPHGGTAEEMYNHLSKRIEEYEGVFLFPETYQEYLIKKLNKR